MRMRRVLPGLVSMLLLGAGAVIASPQPAMAVDYCGWYVTMTPVADAIITKDQAATHDGPLASCPISGRMGYYQGTRIICQHTNSYHNLWYLTQHDWIYSPYVRIVSAPTTVPQCPAPGTGW